MLVKFLVTTVLTSSALAADFTEFYKARYPLPDLYQKMVNNRGEGFEPLYGTRNFRAVLPGLVYRGGANNLFHKTNPRPNMNPLPPDGLENLCREGFKRVVYLYRSNYDPETKNNKCESLHDETNNMLYLQISPHVKEEAYEILKLVYQTIKNPSRGPIYLHCWNGWHFSGLASAYTLRQFCDYSADDAVAYWDANTDGVNTEPQYDKIRNRIRNFEPYPEFKISKRLKAKYCANTLY